jgi:hypothetical protein
MEIGIEVREFAEVMQSVLRSFDERYGTNNYVDKPVEKVAEEVDHVFKKLTTAFENNDMVTAKGQCVHMANMCMILWSKL